jgi:flagellar hook-associated protein 2
LSSVGSSVAVTASGGVLNITSQRYGSASSIVIGDGNGAAGLFGTTTTGTPGLDVAGTLDGVAFLGQGQVATGASATAGEGLALTITGGPTGNRGSVNFNRGIAGNLDTALTQYLDTNNGLVAAATDGLNKSITDLQSQEDSWNTRLVAIRARLTAQYNAMDTLVASLNSTSSYLTQQLDALKKSTSSN